MTPKDQLKPHKHFKNGEWNKYRVLAKGARIQTWVNGKQVSDLVDEEKLKTHPKGFIGLQVHGIGKGSGPYSVAAERQGSRNSFQVNRAVPQDHESPGPFDSFSRRSPHLPWPSTTKARMDSYPFIMART